MATRPSSRESTVSRAVPGRTVAASTLPGEYWSRFANPVGTSVELARPRVSPVDESIGVRAWPLTLDARTTIDGSCATAKST